LQHFFEALPIEPGRDPQHVASRMDYLQGTYAGETQGNKWYGTRWLWNRWLLS
jgi:hypothetical protein